MERENNSNRLLRIREVERLVGLNKSAIYYLMGDGLFPKPLRIGRRAVAWELAPLGDWIASRPEGGSFEPGGNAVGS